MQEQLTSRSEDGQSAVERDRIEASSASASTQSDPGDGTGGSDAPARRRASRYETAYPPLGVFVDAPPALGGGRMHLLDRGPRDDTAIVLIHGASGNLRDFAFQFIDELAAHPAGADRRIIAIDRPGFGYSDRGSAPAHDPAQHARRMRAAVSALGVQRVFLLGHSMGAVSALAWALDAPEMTLGALILSGVSHPWPGTAGYSYDILSTPLLGGLAARLASCLVSEQRAMGAFAPIFAPQSAPDGYGAALGVGLALRPETILANGRDIGHLKPLLRVQATRYGALKQPIEILHGAEDRIVPAAIHAEPLALAAPTARLTLLPGVGHMPHHTARREVFEGLRRMIACASA